MEPLERSAVRLMVYRMVVVFTFFLSALGVQVFIGGESSLQPFFYLIAIALAQNLAYAVLYLAVPPLRRRPLIIHIQIAGDICAVSLLAFYTGGVNSIFTLLYLVLVVVAGYFLKRRGAFVAAMMCALAYGALCVALFYDWVRPDRLGGSFPYDPPSAEGTLYGLISHYTAFFLVAVLVNTLSIRMEAARAALGVMERDISSLRTLNEQLVSSLTWGVVTVGLDGRVTFSNPAAMRLLGETLPAGWDFNARMAELGYGEGLAIQPGDPQEREIELLVGGDRVLGIVVAPLRSPEAPMGHLALIRDHTEVVRLREQLALKDRLAATGAMAADIAHEIKNPLGSISGAAQMLQRKEPEGGDQEALLRIIQTESRRLTEILDNFLRYVKPAPPKKRPVDLSALAEEVLTLFRNDPACGGGITFDLSLPGEIVRIEGDPDQIRQALWNLLQNARKAVSGSGRIGISLTDENETAILTVEDDGVGMRQSQIAEFFQPFRRGFSQGSGLGLSVVFRIMEQHGGRVVIESAPGKGSRCQLLFPARTGP
jgi:two-component system sensor histidine kinase PilS (NtrC family)